MNGTKKNKIGIFIPVRLSSKRFPEKAISDTIFGKPLEFLVNQLSSGYINKKDIVICSTKDICDKKLKSLSKSLKCKFFAGSKLDIIERFYKANLKYSYEYIVEVDGDDILTDFKYIHKCLKIITKNKLDFVYTTGLPIGMNCKVFSSSALSKTFKMKISNNNANGFMSLFKNNPLLKTKRLKFVDLKNYKARFTLDYIEDLKFFEALISLTKINKKNLSLKSYKSILKSNKDLYKINYFKNFDYQKNTLKMKALKIKVGNKVKKIIIN